MILDCGQMSSCPDNTECCSSRIFLISSSALPFSISSLSSSYGTEESVMKLRFGGWTGLCGDGSSLGIQAFALLPLLYFVLREHLDGAMGVRFVQGLR